MFPMLSDIDYLERTLFMLRQNSVFIDKNKFYIIIDITLPTSSYFTNWEKSILDKNFFIDKFNNLKKYADWCDESYFNIDENIRGCIDIGIININKYDVDSMILLDNDVVFNPHTLSTILEASLLAKQQTEHYIITPEYVKMWDNSWDVVVNENFIDKLNNPFYVLLNDPIDDSHIVLGDFNIEPIINNQNSFKFGGGWFTLVSKNILDYIEFPQDIMGYGAIDTIIMEFCKIIPGTMQYKIKNLIVCEDRKYLEKSTYSKYIDIIDRKSEHEQENWEKMMSHLKNKINELSKSK